MKNLKNLFTNSLLVTPRIKAFLSRLNGAITVKSGRGLINTLLRMLILVPFRSSKSWLRVVRTFSKEVHTLTKRNGVAYTVRYLKACAVLLQQSLGGHKHARTQDLGVAVSRTGRGIPRIIPRIHRRLLLIDRRYVIAWLSIFLLYRVLTFKGQLKLSTITAPGKLLPGDLIVSLRTFIQSHFWPMLLRKFGKQTIAEASVERNPKGINPPLVTDWARRELMPVIRPILKASSFQTGKDEDSEISTSRRSMVATAQAWMRDKVMAPYMWEWCHLLARPIRRELFRLVPPDENPTIELWEKIKEFGSLPVITRNNKKKTETRLGRLSLKEEAAGKVRVFAIVDCWTQWIFYPLHAAIFALLRRIPQDGTFDQHAPVKALKIKKSDFVASYDLSAATDRLPLQIQKMVLGPVLGLHLAECWGNLLTKRGYWLKDQCYHYAVGQPMGALSSWAMLALTHHMIVQYSAWRIHAVLPGHWFTRYAVLGDDIVIACPKVAHSYVEVMTLLGVGIGLAKSLVSPKGTMEFAKRFYTPADASPISIKEMAVSFEVAGNLVEIVRKRMEKHADLNLSSVMAYLGYGYKARGSVNKRYHRMSVRMRHWILLLTLPGQPFGLSWDEWMLSLSGTARSTRDLMATYRSVVGVYTETLHSRLRSYQPAIKAAWDDRMLQRNVNKGFAKASPDLLFLTQKVWGHLDIAYQVSEIKKEMLRIAQLTDPREAFMALLKVEESIDLLVLPKDREQRTSVQQKFAWPSKVKLWYLSRKSATSKPLKVKSNISS